MYGYILSQIRPSKNNGEILGPWLIYITMEGGEKHTYQMIKENLSDEGK